MAYSTSLTTKNILVNVLSVILAPERQIIDVLLATSYTLFFFYKNVVFQGQAEYFYFSADFRL